MLSNYCNQDALLEVRSDEKNIYGEYEYATPINIAVRREDKIQEVKTAYEVSVISNTTYYTEKLCKVGDKIDGNEVLFVGYWNDYDGDTIGYKVLV